MLIFDLADPTELQGFVRTIPLNADPETGDPGFPLLAGVLPIDNIDDLEYRFTKGDLFQQDVAQFRAFDAEAGIGKRPGVTRVSGELPPISKKNPLGEEARLRLRQLSRGQTSSPQLVQAIFDDAKNLAASVLGRLELAAGQALYQGKVTIAENGIAAEVDYGFSVEQTPTAPADFDDPATDVIGYLTQLVDEYVARTGGMAPAVMQGSRTIVNALLRNEQVHTHLRGNVSGSAVNVTREQLGQVLAAFDLPPLRTYQRSVMVGGVLTPVIPTDRLLLLPSGQLGRTFSGVTAEALELVDAQQLDASLAPGMVAVNSKTFDPVTTWTKVAAIALPVLANPELVTSAKVRDLP